MTEEQVKAVAAECCVTEDYVVTVIEDCGWPDNPADFLGIFTVLAEVTSHA